MNKNPRQVKIGHELLALGPLSFAFLLLLNDWVLKKHQFLPSFIRGKLSDIAGLYFFPLALSALIGCGYAALNQIMSRKQQSPPPSKKRLWFCYTATGLSFWFIKTSPFFNQIAETFFLSIFGRSKIVMDLSDLICLPILWVSYHVTCKRIHPTEETK